MLPSFGVRITFLQCNTWMAYTIVYEHLNRTNLNVYNFCDVWFGSVRFVCLFFFSSSEFYSIFILVFSLIFDCIHPQCKVERPVNIQVWRLHQKDIEAMCHCLHIRREREKKPLDSRNFARVLCLVYLPISVLKSIQTFCWHYVWMSTNQREKKNTTRWKS